MQDLVAGWPYWAVLVAFWAGAFARGTASYWVGRGARAGGGRSRWAPHLERPTVRRAERWVARLGPAAVTLGFLTVGLQTAINVSAGALRMPPRRFVPAVLLGALVWAVLYTTVGLAVIDAWFGGLSWWWALAALVGLVAVVLVVQAVGRRVPGDQEQDSGRPEAG